MSDRDWRSWWNMAPAAFSESEFLRQVGRTENGRPTDERDIAASVTAAIGALEIDAKHIVADLCCGNGLITRAISLRCQKIFGIDYSEALLSIARKHHAAPNIVYVHSSVIEITPITFTDVSIDRAYMCFSTQYFDEAMLTQLLHTIKAVASPGFQLFLDDIPDEACLTAFYNTPERWQEYQRRKADGIEAIGQWWRRERLIEIAAEAGYRCRTIDQEPHRRRAHYRFDALLLRL